MVVVQKQSLTQHYLKGFQGNIKDYAKNWPTVVVNKIQDLQSDFIFNAHNLIIQ